MRNIISPRGDGRTVKCTCSSFSILLRQIQAVAATTQLLLSLVLYVLDQTSDIKLLIRHSMWASSAAVSQSVVGLSRGGFRAIRLCRWIVLGSCSRSSKCLDHNFCLRHQCEKEAKQPQDSDAGGGRRKPRVMQAMYHSFASGRESHLVTDESP